MSIERMADEIFEAVRGFIGRALEPIAARLSTLEAGVKALAEVPRPRDGKDGRDGERGERGEKGADGAPGRDGERGERGERGEKGADGAPGRDGRDGQRGEPGRDAAQIHILPAIDVERSYSRGTYAAHQGGLWQAQATTEGMSGWACIVDGLAQISVEMIDERTIAVVSTRSSGVTERKTLRVRNQIHRGPWKKGSYEQDDNVTYGGSIWCALRDTDATPGSSADDWRLVVKGTK